MKIIYGSTQYLLALYMNYTPFHPRILWINRIAIGHVLLIESWLIRKSRRWRECHQLGSFVPFAEIKKRRFLTSANVNFEHQMNLGISLIDPSVILALKTLWEGPIYSDSLPAIDMGIRAFIVGQKLCIGQKSILSGDDSNYEADIGSGGGKQHQYAWESTNPLSGDPIEFEFCDPTELDFAKLSNEEWKVIRSRVECLSSSAVESALQEVDEYSTWNFLLDWSEQRGCIDVDYSYINFPPHQGFEGGYLKEKYVDSITTYARYLVNCHYSGLSVFAANKVADSCNDHIFSFWPDKLFENFTEDYKKEARELRGPSIGVDLPPFVALLLSRVSSRDSIPETLINMREEYRKSREELWALLKCMWQSDSKRQQREALRALTAAKDDLFVMSSTNYFERLNYLNLAVGLTLSPAKAVDSIRAADRPNVGVTAVSFTGKLAKDFKKNLLSDNASLKRIFTESEIKDLHRS